MIPSPVFDTGRGPMLLLDDFETDLTNEKTRSTDRVFVFHSMSHIVQFNVASIRMSIQIYRLVACVPPA